MEDDDLLSATGNGERDAQAGSISRKETIESVFGKSMGRLSVARIRKTPAQKCKWSQFTACNISDRLRENHLLPRGSQHAVDDGLRIGQKLVKARLHDYIIGFRQSRFLLKIPYLRLYTTAFQTFDECAAKVQTGIANRFPTEISIVEHSRSATKIQNARVRRNKIGNRPVASRIIAAVQQNHQHFV